MTNAFGEWMNETAFEEADSVFEETRGGNFLRLKNDGDECELVIQGLPHPFRTVWVNGSSERYNPDNEAHEGIRPSGRFNWPVAVKTDEKAYTSMVWETSGETYDAIKEALAEYSPKTVFKVKRKGTGTDTKYMVLFKRKLEGGELEHVASLEKLETEPGAASSSNSEPSDVPEAGDSPWG